MKLPTRSVLSASSASAIVEKFTVNLRALLMTAHSCSMKITEDVRKYAAEQAISEEEALQKGMEEKAAEFVEKGAEVYAKA
jgi:uncharacterized protein YllA (UPF0747 family)